MRPVRRRSRLSIRPWRPPGRSRPATALVNHENIVVIHEVDEVDDVPYMVLEYLEGAPLRKLLDGNRLATGRAVEIAAAIVRALVRAHEAGIVHRDLKPENVFVTESGNIKVLDF